MFFTFLVGRGGGGMGLKFLTKKAKILIMEGVFLPSIGDITTLVHNIKGKQRGIGPSKN